MAADVPPFDLLDEVDVGGLKAAVVRAALELDVFTLVGRGAGDVEALADAAGCSRRGMGTLVRALLSLGLLERDAAGVLRCSPTATAYLAADGLGLFASILLDWMRHRDRLVETVRSGRPGGHHAGHDAADLWVSYAAPDLVPWPAVVPTLAETLAERGVALLPGARVLDLGCGSGIVGFTLIRDDPDATLVAVDREPVLGVARRLARQMGVDVRVEFVAGDADGLAWPPGSFDAAVCVNVAQYLDDNRLAALLTRTREALAPEGLLYLVAPAVDDGSHGLETNWATAVEMFLVTDVDSRTAQDYRRLLAATGFGSVAVPAPNRFVARAAGTLS